MAKATRKARLETRTARSKLSIDHEPYWVGIGQGLYLGYRKGPKSGNWLARYYKDGKYKKKKLGKADDYQDANAIDVISYFQAQDSARKFADEQAKTNPQITHNVKVAEVLEGYLSWFKINRKSYQRTLCAINAHILPIFGDFPVADLTSAVIRKWHEFFVKQPPKLRSTPIKQNYREIDNTQEGMRKRKATANRILAIFKAALNHGWQYGLISSDEAWRKVKPFRGVESPKLRYLQLDECQRLINICLPDFRLLVRAALLTGCRYGELTRIKVNDFDAIRGQLFISETKNGRSRYLPLTEEGINFFNEVTISRFGNEHVFLRENGLSWGKSHQSRRLKEACKIAKIEPAISFHILRHTYGSLLASKGVSLQVIAELLGHSDTRITNRHYAHLMPSYVADTLKANLPEFVGEQEEKVLKLSLLNDE